MFKKTSIIITSAVWLSACNSPVVINQNPREAIENIEELAKQRLSEKNEVSLRRDPNENSLPQLLDLLNLDTSTQAYWRSVFGTDSSVDIPFAVWGPQGRMPLPRTQEKSAQEITEEFTQSNNPLNEKLFEKHKDMIVTALKNLAPQKTPYFFNHPQERPVRFATDDAQTVLVLYNMGLPIRVSRDQTTANQRASILVKDHLLPALRSISNAFEFTEFEKITVSFTYGTPSADDVDRYQQVGSEETVAMLVSLKDLKSHVLQLTTSQELLKKSKVYQSTTLDGMREVSQIDLSI